MEHASRTPSLSVVIPAYNEAGRIREPLASVHAYLRAQPYESEVVVVDDGSEDATFDVVRNATRGWDVPVRAFRYRPNVGKGYAIKFGVARARGDRILFTDADLSTPIEQTGAFLARLDAGADVVIGSRKTPWAEIVVHQPWYREQLGKAYKICPKESELLFSMGNVCMALLRDSNCALKYFEDYTGTKKGLAKDHRVFQLIDSLKQMKEQEKNGPAQAPQSEPPQAGAAKPDAAAPPAQPGGATPASQAQPPATGKVQPPGSSAAPAFYGDAADAAAGA